MKLSVWLLAGIVIIANGAAQGADDQHWSLQFAKPANTQSMSPATGMASGNSKPVVNRVKWHDGKLWMAGYWAPGVSALDMSKRLQNQSWHLWSWSPEYGYEVYSYLHTVKGGSGPDNQISDFVFLPDGRIVVVGGFTRVDNPNGTRYHRVNALAVYNPNEPTANKWQPLGTFQYNGTVSETGSLEAIAYDPQGNDLYVGGSHAGILAGEWEDNSPKIHRYDFDTGYYEPMSPGVNGVKAFVRRIKVDTTTTPSTIYVAGKFQYTGGNGLSPTVSESTARYSPGIATWQEGVGWTTFPREGSIHNEDILQRAADFMHFDSVHVLDFLLDGEDLWIVGAFSGGSKSGQTIRGIAKWDAVAEQWVDPTGKGGVGREVWSIARADNGKFYFAGSFGGFKNVGDYFEGFKDGADAHHAISFDPATGEWTQLGSGLMSLSFPEVRMTTDGNDVYYVGDFNYIGVDNDQQKAWESWFIARWNEDVDFSANPVSVADKAAPSPAAEPAEVPLSVGNEHWSRKFVYPPRRKRPDELAHTAQTGMDFGTGPPDTVGIAWLGDTLYFAGNYPAMANERWYVWSYHAEGGWEKLAWDALGDSVGPDAVPMGLKVHDNKLWVFGGLPKFKGIAIYDPDSKEWEAFHGTWKGKAVMGHAVEQGGGAIRDLAWDSETGDMFIVGATGLENEAYEYPGDVAPVIRVDKDGNYHPMGHDIKVEDPNKPRKVFQTIYLDETVEPTGIFIGGTFSFNGPVPTKTDRRVYNVAKWDPVSEDWAPIGKGLKTAWVDEKHFPEGYPGLPHRPGLFGGFLRKDFPAIRDLTMDANGNLYAVGTLGLLDYFTLPVSDRVETFGIARWNHETNEWEGPTNIGGFSRDPLQMTWLDKARTQLLLSGAFEYDNNWRAMNGVAILDVTTGEASALGGGLMPASREQVVAPMVRHAVRGNEIWLAGLFDHAGVNANATFADPIQSSYVAMWDSSKDLSAVAPVEATSTTGSTAASGADEKLHSRVAYKMEQVEKELDKAEKSIAAGKPARADRPAKTIERLLMEIERGGQNMEHPRIATAAGRLEAVRAAMAGG